MKNNTNDVNNRYREEEKEEMQNEEKLEENVNNESKEEKNELSELEKLNEQLHKANNNYLRVLADFENYKKRSQEEMIKDRKYANQSLLEKLIVSFDIFDKAVSINTDDEKLKNFLMGFSMINNNLKQILEEEGVKKIVTKDSKFNPSFHHAMETDWDETKEEGIILAELQCGYTYKDRVLRPSLVKVNQKMKGNE